MLRPISLRRALAMLVLLCTTFLGTSASAQGFRPRHGPEGQGGEPPPFVPGRILVQFRPDVPAQQVRHLIAAARAQWLGEIPQIGVYVLQLPPSASEVAVARAFGQRPEVIFAELDRILPPEDITPNDPYYASWQWALKKIQCPTAWSTTTGNNSVIIAILDTGVDGTHPDLSAKMVPGWNFYDNNSDTRDVYGHGTKVAGTAAASSNNAIGVASVAWECKIMPIRVSDPQGYGYFSAMASGLTWAADRGARVANISYSISGSATVSAAAQYFRSRGGVVTVSAGNNGTFYNYPDDPNVLTIAATDSYDNITSYSTTGTHLDLAAPGTAYTTTRGGSYSAVSGTSISAPIVAGVAALVISANPNLAASQVEDILKQSADDLGATGWDSTYGWGRVNAARALSLASSGSNSGGSSSFADTTPPSVKFTSPTNDATVSGTVSVQVSASDNVGVASVTLYLDGTAVASTSTAPYAFSWNTTSVVDGVHTLKAVAVDAANNTSSAQISVTVRNVVDSSPPVVSILSPSDGASVGGIVTVSVSAMDDSGVVKMELYVDGKLTTTSTSAPFTLKWNTRKAANGPHTLQCKAYDAAGNVGNSQTVTVYK